MARIIIVALIAALVAFSAATMAQQGSRASRWQPEQFGPIVPTDTMWSIATYYGRQRGVSLFEMMDAIVAANPRAFRDNRPDFMLTGFYLEIPELGSLATAQDTPKAAVPAPSSDAASTAESSEAESPEAKSPDVESTAVESTAVESEIAISVSEMQALRGQLSESIGLIESLQTENSDLQQRLEAVTEELNLLRQRAAEEQRASAEIETLASELNRQDQQELTTTDVQSQPSERNPALDVEQPVEQTTAEPDAASESNADSTTASAAETDAATAVVEEKAEVVSKPVVNRPRSQQRSWLDWLLKPLHLGLMALVLVIVLGALWYLAYVRRLEREMAAEPAADQQSDKGEEYSDKGQEHSDKAEESAAGQEESIRDTSTADDGDGLAPEDWQEMPSELMSTADEDVEITDVDLEAYLSQQSDATAESDDDDDAISREVDALLAFEPSEQESDDEDSKESAAPEPVNEYRQPEPEPEDDSFGGLSLDDNFTTSDSKESDAEAADDDYVSIESLMEEAESEASEELDDPYDKDKLNEALVGDDDKPVDYDISTEAMLDESKSPAARLDLAQVYIDMGEIDDARNLLEGIQGCDDEEAEQEAAALLKQLSEQGGR
ncbi:hypothetical protein PSI9734_00097 [Pseudidiomarina piscicola]|uniref:LysM domain-containing protein n=1 Tax=Pseudidiomarina piscicola TaxID=2614830 RepID=A0A6S6WK66_9GAMM|nr:FimV/HubP family polar landmark protein [Pseudidiomarina piscicola]CAB0149533.1 hypothetical protein PSI9734_00097 [Pseudidiomarina piscicola]VZT38981.1 hypothetical protein PSI9734_00097 [Pseudomonas aeruginosa]